MQLSQAALCLSLCLISCAHGRPHPPEAPPPGAEGHSATEQQVQSRYQAAGRALDRGLYQDAIKDFEAIRTEFPYSQYAALSELRIADAHMRRSQYLEAIDAYRTFLRFHPSHPDAPYALGRVGEAYYAQIPQDYYLMPPAAEKDLGHVKEAIAAYQDLLARYPQASGAPEAQKHLKACQRKLADHEMYVARFYFARKQWAGAVLRLTGLLRDYPGLGLDPDALYMAAQAHAQLGQMDQAVASVTRLLADYPNTQAGRRAQSLLEHLEGRMQ